MNPDSAQQRPDGDGPITVAIIEDHPLFREALTRALKERGNLAVVAAVGTGREGIDAVNEFHPRVCVLDLGLPDMEGAAVLERLLRDDPALRVLVLSGDWQSDVVYAMIEAGAAGFERKTAGPDELLEAVRVVARGESVIPQELHAGLAEQIRARRSESAPALSEREIEILKALAEGRSAAEVAAQMNLAESTVKTQLTRIYDKLGVSERAAAVAKAFRTGLID
jgi:two-component system nitrate/nitrite response regulator NarL